MDILKRLKEEESKYLQMAKHAKQQLGFVRDAMKMVRNDRRTARLEGKCGDRSENFGVVG